MKKKFYLLLLPLLLLSACGSNQPVCNHTDLNHDHTCDNCGTKISDHTDNNTDHQCDICRYKMSDHTDNDKNHVCDYCHQTISNHTDTNTDHYCDYCKEKISEHTDEDTDHYCDYCETKLSDHEDKDKDHICDYCDEDLPFDLYVTYKSSDYEIEYGDKFSVDKLEDPNIYYVTIDVSEKLEILIRDDEENSYTSYDESINTVTDGFATSCVKKTSSNHLVFNVFGKFVIKFDKSKASSNITVTINKVTCYDTSENDGSSYTHHEDLLFDAVANKPQTLSYSLKRTDYTFISNQTIQIRSGKKTSGLKHFTLGSNTSTSWFVLSDTSNYSYVTFKGNESHYFSITVTVDIATYSVVVDFVKIGSK